MSDRDLGVLACGLKMLGDGREESGSHELAQFFWALMIEVGDEVDRRKIALQELAWSLDEYAAGHIVPDDDAGS
jgi:hypothetical protein